MQINRRFFVNKQKKESASKANHCIEKSKKGNVKDVKSD